ncbi:MAG: GIY-YIG nuclease family protein [Ferruginibacter sp.]|nr:GIY-YIG nuclease family protein [Chitinophagaceae bacterium]
MFYAYVIKSLNHDFYYKGHCEDLDQRLKQHNSGMTESIRPYLPFKLVYKEEFNTRAEAISREKYLKSSAGRRFLKYKLASWYNAYPDNKFDGPDREAGQG